MTLHLCFRCMKWRRERGRLILKNVFRETWGTYFEISTWKQYIVHLASWQEIKIKSGILLLVIQCFFFLLCCFYQGLKNLLGNQEKLSLWVRCRIHLWTLCKSWNNLMTMNVLLFSGQVWQCRWLIPLSSVLYCKKTCHKCNGHMGFAWRWLLKRPTKFEVFCGLSSF